MVISCSLYPVTHSGQSSVILRGHQHLTRDAGADRVLAAMDDAIASGSPTAELVRYHLYGQQMPSDAFEIEHGDLADYDRLISGGVGEDGG